MRKCELWDMGQFGGTGTVLGFAGTMDEIRAIVQMESGFLCACALGGVKMLPEVIASSAEPSLVCQQCGVDRLKEPCPGMADECGMVADAHLLATPERSGQAAQEQAAPALTDADIRRIATDAYKDGGLSWLGFDIDPYTMQYSIPVLSGSHYQLCYAIERHLTGATPARGEG